MQIIIPFRAFSVNDYYYGNRKYGKKADAKSWEHQVNWVLKEYTDEFAEFKKTFDDNQHGLRVTITHLYSNFFLKSGKLNKKLFDLSNTEKPLLDLILNPVNYGQAPYKSPNLQIDDCHVLSLHSFKRPGEDAVIVDIELENLPLKL